MCACMPACYNYFLILFCAYVIVTNAYLEHRLETMDEGKVQEHPVLRTGTEPTLRTGPQPFTTDMMDMNGDEPC